MSYKTIKLKKYEDIINEYEAGGTVLPGALLQLTADNTVENSSAAGDKAPALFALEDELQGKTTRQSYSENDRVQTWYVQPGEEVLALVDSGFDPDVGTLLEPGTGGQLRAHDAGTAQYQVIGSKFVDDDDSNHRLPVRRI